MGKLMSKCVYIKIKDEYHLNELFDLCKKYNKPIYKNDFNFKTRVFSYNKINRKHSGYYYECDRTEVTIEEFEKILKSEQQWDNLSSKNVYVKIKDAKHLNRLFEISELHKISYLRDVHDDTCEYFYYLLGYSCKAFSNWFSVDVYKYTEVTTEEFEQILKQENNVRSSI